MPDSVELQIYAAKIAIRIQANALMRHLNIAYPKNHGENLQRKADSSIDNPEPPRRVGRKTISPNATSRQRHQARKASPPGAPHSTITRP